MVSTAYAVKPAETRKAEGLLRKSGRKLLFYHNDPDGICSAAMLLRFFSGFETDVRKGPVMDSSFVRDVIKKEPALLVFVDLPVDQEWKKLERIERTVPGLEMLVIDHHIYERDLNSKRLLHINPRLEGEAYIPAAYIVYRMLEQMDRRVKPVLWVAAIGVIGDYGFDECRDLMDQCRRRHPGLLGENALGSKLGHAAELISHAVTLKGNSGARKSLEFLLKSESFEDFISIPELGGWKREVDEEFEKITKMLKREKEEYPGGVVTFKIDTKMGLNSTIANHLSEQYPDKVIIVRRRIGKGDKKHWKLSLRCQSGRINVGELTKMAVRSIGTGGGHGKAAGAMVNDWDKFMKRFLSAMEKGSG